MVGAGVWGRVFDFFWGGAQMLTTSGVLIAPLINSSVPLPKIDWTASPTHTHRHGVILGDSFDVGIARK